MKKAFLFITILILVLFLKVNAKAEIIDAWILDNPENYTTSPNLNSNIFDNDVKTGDWDTSKGLDGWIYLNKRSYVSKFYTYQGFKMNLYFYDEDGSLVYSIYQQQTSAVEIPLNKYIKSVKIVNPSAGFYTPIFEFDLYGYMINEPLENPIMSLSSTVNKVNVSWHTVPDAQGYKIFLNDNEIVNLDNTYNQYTFENLNHDTSYNVKVLAYAKGYIDGVTASTIKTLNYYSAKPNANVDISQYYATIKWTPLPDTKYYEVQLGTGEIFQTTNTFYTFENLQLETDYIAHVRHINVVDVVSAWTDIQFTTLGIPEVAPSKPDNVKILSKGIDFIEVEVSETLWATKYKFSLNNVEKITQESRIYKFTGLTANTTYSISVKSVNDYGTSMFSASLVTTTNEIPYPVVTNAQSSFGNGGKTQTVTWQGKNVSEGYKILVNGQLVKEVDSTTNTTTIDLTDLNISGSSATIEVIPKDANGKGYKFEAVIKGTGNSDLDVVTGKILDAKNIIKNGGMALLISIIAVLLLFVVALFLFNKMKLNLATNDDDSLEANPDEQIKAIDSKNKFDRDAYFIAKVEEGNHDKKKNDDFNIKSFLNGAINKPDKKEKKYKIKVKGKNIELDKTSYFANKYTDFGKLGNKTEFYQWQNKYNDFSQSSFNKFSKKRVH